MLFGLPTVRTPTPESVAKAAEQTGVKPEVLVKVVDDGANRAVPPATGRPSVSGT
jgi:hypothetical protein